jgi:hypothetical protein
MSQSLSCSDITCYGLKQHLKQHLFILSRRQCEDSCHRFGQKKDVDVVYYDAKFTIDRVMGKSFHAHPSFAANASSLIFLRLHTHAAEINECKTSNSEILLADGPSLMASDLSFKETSGLFGRLLGRVQRARSFVTKSDPPATKTEPRAASSDSNTTTFTGANAHASGEGQNHIRRSLPLEIVIATNAPARDRMQGENNNSRLRTEHENADHVIDLCFSFSTSEGSDA